MVRQTALTFLTRAGTEIGVASTKAFTTQLVAQFLLALTLAKLRGRLSRRRRGEVAARPAPPAGGDPGRARARAAPHRVGAGVREKAARAVPRARPALPDRARRRAQAQGNLVHPRRGVSGRRAEARAARAGRCADAGGRHRAQRRAARKAQVATCRKCARAAASSMSSPISTATSPRGDGMHLIRVSEHAGLLSPIVHVVPLQLLAYHARCCAGRMSTSRGTWRRA